MPLLRVQNAFISVDPDMRWWISAAKNYVAPYSVDEVMSGAAVVHVGELRTLRKCCFPSIGLLGMPGLTYVGLTRIAELREEGSVLSAVQPARWALPSGSSRLLVPRRYLALPVVLRSVN